jgi:hypothetical protein
MIVSTEQTCTGVLKRWAAGQSQTVIHFFEMTICVVETLMHELDPTHEGPVNEEEFLLILKFI